jgi:TonB family protein
MRVPPQYPEKCLAAASDYEKVVVEIDVTADGAAENPRVIESTGRCFHAAAMASVEKWRYAPKLVDGVAVPRRGVQTQITFELGGSFKDLMRPIVAQKLDKVRSRLVKKAPDHAAILADLDAIEADYGDGFRSLEMSAFYPLRAATRTEVKNYRGALDDLRIARQRVVEEKSADAIQKTIEQLEAYYAADDSATKPDAESKEIGEPTAKE